MSMAPEATSLAAGAALDATGSGVLATGAGAGAGAAGGPTQQIFLEELSFFHQHIFVHKAKNCRRHQ